MLLSMAQPPSAVAAKRLRKYWESWDGTEAKGCQFFLWKAEPMGSEAKSEASNGGDVSSEFR
jgi:hypothetical protein